MSSWLENSHLAAEGLDYEPELSDEMPSLGSVTCFYNEEDIIEESLQGLEEAAEQSDFYQTVYAVDDGSEDNTAELIEAYAEESDVVEFIQMDENTGKFGAQKHCTEIMEEDYWLSIDADSKIENPGNIDYAVTMLEGSDSEAAMLEMRPETEGEGFLGTVYEQMQKLEYSMRRGIDNITSNGEISRVVTASGTATLGKTQTIEEAMEHHSGNYAGDDRELTSILQLKMDEEVEYLPEIEITTDAPYKPKEHLEQRRTWSLGQINAISEHPKEHAESLTDRTRYSGALGLDMLGTATTPLLINKATEIANSGNPETLALTYGGAAGIAGLAYTNATIRGETLNSKTKKGKTKELAKDVAALSLMPIYTTATRAYSVHGALKDKIIGETTQEMKKGYEEAKQTELEVTERNRTSQYIPAD